MPRPLFPSSAPGRALLALLVTLAAAGCDLFGSDPVPTTVNLAPVFVELDAVGETRTLTPEVLDEEGNVMSGQSVTWTSSNTAVASVSPEGVLMAEGNGNATITATVGRASGTMSVVVAQRVTQLVLLSGGSQVGAAGEPLAEAIVVVARDRLGNAASGTDLQFSVQQGGGSFSPPIVTTNAQGLASSVWTLGTTAGFVQVARVRTGPEGAALTALATSVAGAVARIELLDGNGQAAPRGRPLPRELAVQIMDRFDNPVPQAPVSFTAVSGGGTFTPGTALSGTDGVAVSLWTLGSELGNQGAEVTAGDGLAPLSASAVALAVPGVLRREAGNDQTVAAGTAVPIPPSVRVEDSDGAPVVGLTVLFTATGGEGTVSGAEAVTDGDGVATVGSWRLGNRVGSNTLTVSLDELPPVEFTATGVAGPPAALERISGSAQSGPPGGTLPSPLRLRVQDAFGNGIEGISVRFATQPGNGSVGPQTQVSGPDGTVTANWTLDAVQGTQVARAASLGPELNEVIFVAAAVSGVTPSAFSIEIRYVQPVADQNQEIAVEAAAARWASLIVGDVPDIRAQTPANFCGVGERALDEVIDDLLIYVRLAPIDGPGQILGSAGPCAIRRIAGETVPIPALGVINLDSEDLARLDDATLQSLVLHEMGHVLGIGSLWRLQGLLQNPSLPNSPGVDTHFSGLAAIDAFDELGGATYVGLKVPVENSQGGQGTRDSHWRESVLRNELMTGFLSQGTNPLSRITTGSLRDMGYILDETLVDVFTVPSGAAAAPGMAPELQGLDLGDDIYRIPIKVLDENGVLVQTIPLSFR
jgi:hypothetical protein